MKVVKVIGRHRYQDDDGVIYDVIEKQDFIDASTKDGDELLEGLKWFELPNGRKLNWIDDRTLRIVSTGVTVRLID